jgi:hypothetical protein
MMTTKPAPPTGSVTHTTRGIWWLSGAHSRRRGFSYVCTYPEQARCFGDVSLRI